MKHFWKENSKLVSKMVVYQLAAIILGVTTAFATDQNQAWFVASSVFSSVFYLFLLCSVSYLEGREDGIRMEAGKIKFRPLRMLAVSALANSLGILLSVLLMLFAAIPASWAESAAQAIFIADSGVLHIMYRGMAKCLTSDSYWLTALMPLPALIVTTVAYLFGIRFKNGFIRRPKDASGTSRYIGDPKQK